jgi:ankyrin repeat protein
MPICDCQAKAKAKADAESKSHAHAHHGHETKTPVTSSASSSASKPNPKSQFGHFSSFSNQNQVKVEVDLKGDLNLQCREALKRGDLAQVKLLLDSKANVQYIDQSGNTFLHLACMFDKIDMAKLILEHGGDPLVKNQRGETALQLAPATLALKIKAGLASSSQTK